MAENEAPKKRGIIQPTIGVLAAVGAIFAYLVVLALTVAVFDLGAKMAHPDARADEIKEMTYSLATVSGIVGNIAAAGILALILYIMKRKIGETLRLRSFSPLAVVPCVLLGAAFNFFSECAVALIPFPDSVIETYKEIYSYLGKGSIALEIVGVVIVTPIVEEIFFRGVAYRLLRRRMGAALSVILSSVFFGLAHGNVLSFIYTTALGVILAVTFEAHGSIFVPIVIHASFNATSYVTEYVLVDPSAKTLAFVAAISGAVAAAAFIFAVKTAKKRKINSQSAERTGTE